MLLRVVGGLDHSQSIVGKPTGLVPIIFNVSVLIHGPSTAVLWCNDPLLLSRIITARQDARLAFSVNLSVRIFLSLS